MIDLKENEEALSAVCRLLGDSDFGIFLLHLKKSRESIRDDNEKANGNEVYRGSGRSLELSELLEEVRQAKKTKTALEQAANDIRAGQL